MDVISGTAGNLLRDPRDRRLPRVPGPCAVVVFGVTGDLSRKKLIPAIYDLSDRGLLPPGFALLGFARRDWGDGDFESLVQRITDQVMLAMNGPPNGQGSSVVKGQTYASGLSGGV